jgi:hypothetical protein
MAILQSATVSKKEAGVLGTYLSMEPDLVNNIWTLGLELFLLVTWDSVGAFNEVTSVVGENRKFLEFRGCKHFGRCRGTTKVAGIHLRMRG